MPIPISLQFLAPVAPPENITALALTSETMLVTWDLPLPQYRNGPILAYNLTVMDPARGVLVETSILLTTSSVVLSLRPFTVYVFYLSARTSVGYGPVGNTSEVTLQDSKCYN